jgi:outer membrane cobalamin receptor
MPRFVAARIRPAALPLLSTALFAALPIAARAQDNPAPAATSDGSTEQISVIAERLNRARDSIQPSIGASSYGFTNDQIETIPGGDNNPVNQITLQAPGVDQDNLANGGLHVRNEHLNVQYRIDGVILPDGVSFFGQSIDPRFIDTYQLVTGALPAEYGLRTAGVIDITTKDQLFQSGGTAGINGGSFGTIEPSLTDAGQIGDYGYFVSADYLQSNRGVEAVTPAYNQIHDRNEEAHGFADLDRILDAEDKLSLLLSTFDSQFQIPNNPVAAPFAGITAVGSVPIDDISSTNLTEHQTETVQFGALSYLHAADDLNFQLTAFTKYSTLHFHPDSIGDIAFTGVAQEANRTSFASGGQADGSLKLGPDHTLRAGALITIEHITADTDNSVLEQIGTDPVGNPIFGTVPQTIVSDSEKTGYTYSAYLQDEWHVLPDVTLNYGGRFDIVNGFTEGNQLSPRVNAVWQAGPATTIHAGYASYFTPPPLELASNKQVSLFANTSGAPPETLSSPIKNERAQYLDIGVIQDVLPNFKIGIDAYYKYSRNLLDEGQFGSPVILTPFNYHVGFNRGVEVTTSYQLGDFAYYGNLAIAEQKAEGINSAQFSFDPADLAFTQNHLVNTDHSQLATASGGVSYSADGTRASLDILAGSGLRTQPPGETFNEGTVPSYEQVNLGLSHRFDDVPGGALTASLTVINLLDQTYLLRSQTGIGEFTNQFAPRRSVFVSLTKEF